MCSIGWAGKITSIIGTEFYSCGSLSRFCSLSQTSVTVTDAISHMASQLTTDFSLAALRPMSKPTIDSDMICVAECVIFLKPKIVEINIFYTK